MFIGEPSEFITDFVGNINDAIGEYGKKSRLSTSQRYWIAFCIMGIIMTNTVCRAKFERAGLGKYAMSALSWMLRHSGIQWEILLCSSVSCILKSFGIREGTLAIDDSEKNVPKIQRKYRKSVRLRIKKVTDTSWGNQ